MSKMPDGQTTPPTDEANLQSARARYALAIRGLRADDEVDICLRQELEQAIERIDLKLAQLAARRALMERM